MNAADRTYLDGFRAALAIAHATADRIATGSMPTLRREMAAEALRAFADESQRAMLAAKLANIPFGANQHGGSANLPVSPMSHADASSQPSQSAALVAIGLGYVGEACPECANFTLVRNGTCLKCDTCGSTTGCS